MVSRWTKRGLWIVLMAVLVVAPARLAQGPERAEAAAVGAMRGDGGVGAVPWAILAGTLLLVPAYLMVARARR